MKRKAARQTARFDEYSHTIRGGWQNSLKGGGRLYLVKVGLVRVRWHRPLPSAPSAVTVTRETDGRWWATFTVQVPVEPARPPVHEGRAAGVDIGTEDIALVYSDKTRAKVMTLRAERDDTHEKRTGPQSYRQAEKRLAALDQELSRKTRGSNNRKRTQRKRALLHTRLKNLRTDFARQMAAQLTSENQVVVVETLGVREMVQDAHAKSVLDTAFATITREVALAAEKRGTTLIEAPRYFAGTRTCSHCGTKGPKRPTRVRDWRCASCGAVLDRDYNASVNHLMLAAGSAESLNGWTPEDRRQLASLPGEGNHVVLERPRAVRRGSVCEDPVLADVDSVREHSPRTTQVAARGLAPRPQGIPTGEDLRDLQKDAAR
ncbi:RNA-guided endonuclease TnpB family protein [Microbacterium sp. AG1240]|uniref:RNA-guided endonuclease InsQ/TnpB family protein n=1 Tax=Microbacterium sp. AG1240 TaxID=2183992 RepID=UPI000EB4C28D|nr:RNA-guided endonuclease TnpB family protein [Microbacterium sp. AG1240]